MQPLGSTDFSAQKRPNPSNVNRLRTHSLFCENGSFPSALESQSCALFATTEISKPFVIYQLRTLLKK